jgi:hypothetical protein
MSSRVRRAAAPTPPILRPSNAMGAAPSHRAALMVPLPGAPFDFGPSRDAYTPEAGSFLKLTRWIIEHDAESWRYVAERYCTAMEGAAGNGGPFRMTEGF